MAANLQSRVCESVLCLFVRLFVFHVLLSGLEMQKVSVEISAVLVCKDESDPHGFRSAQKSVQI